MSFILSIAREEGFFVHGSRSGRNNNPGNLNWGDFARAHGAVGIETIPAGVHEPARFALFPDSMTGFNAMKALLEVPGHLFHDAHGDHLSSGYAGSTVHECLYRWAPPADKNDTSSYETNVCSWTRCKPTDCIDALVADS